MDGILKCTFHPGHFSVCAAPRLVACVERCHELVAACPEGLEESCDFPCDEIPGADLIPLEGWVSGSDLVVQAEDQDTGVVLRVPCRKLSVGTAWEEAVAVVVLAEELQKFEAWDSSCRVWVFQVQEQHPLCLTTWLRSLASAGARVLGGPPPEPRPSVQGRWWKSRWPAVEASDGGSGRGTPSPTPWHVGMEWEVPGFFSWGCHGGVSASSEGRRAKADTTSEARLSDLHLTACSALPVTTEASRYSVDSPPKAESLRCAEEESLVKGEGAGTLGQCVAARGVLVRAHPKARSRRHRAPIAVASDDPQCWTPQTLTRSHSGTIRVAEATCAVPVGPPTPAAATPPARAGAAPAATTWASKRPAATHEFSDVVPRCPDEVCISSHRRRAGGRSWHGLRSLGARISARMAKSRLPSGASGADLLDDCRVAGGTEQGAEAPSHLESSAESGPCATRAPRVTQRWRWSQVLRLFVSHSSC
mmetsp:Transcript_83614/g.190820  ORF Transcript_83614/g.190820 Transcript_83614/m.190820 type:complete len:477 (-) Transcript_83614:96-1526(-)